MHTFPGQTRLMWSLQTPQLYDIFCISTNSACSSVFFQAWISTCHWTLLNASISIVDNLDMNSASHLHWDCSLLHSTGQQQPHSCGVFGTFGTSECRLTNHQTYLDLLEISPITLFSTNLETEKKKIKWSSRKGNHVCHILSFWLHGVVLYLDFALQLNA